MPEVVDQSAQQKLSKISFESDSARRSIISAYWAIVLLALPLWWYTTSIERLSLPSGRVLQETDRNLQLSVNLRLSSGVDSVFVSQLQQLFVQSALHDHSRWEGIDVHISLREQQNFRDSANTYEILLGESETYIENRQISLSQEDSHSLSHVFGMLSGLIAPYSSLYEYRVAPYAPRYRLAFTLLNEDASTGSGISGWDVRGAIARHVTPILDQLSTLHNFTVESQIQFHAPLAFLPRSLNDGYGLTQEDLTVFINSAEWTLSSSVTSDPVLHLVLFLPSSTRRPLHILDAHSRPLDSNAFILPQWGGIVLLNLPMETEGQVELSAEELDHTFATFATQLLTLLGVPRLPVGILPKEPSFLTTWQLDTLLRRRALENTRRSQDTLKSIIKLVQEIENMPVGQSVRDDLHNALAALDRLFEAAHYSSAQALCYSSQALSFASRAFFNPGMLALLYFPAEHKYAIYTPLFASAMVPLIAAAARELFAWKRGRSGAIERSNVPDNNQ